MSGPAIRSKGDLMTRFFVAATIVLLSGAFTLGQSTNQQKGPFPGRPQSGRESPLGVYLGRLSANKYGADSTSNRYGVHGSPYSSRSIHNPYGTHGRAVRNPYAGSQSSPILIGEDGTYLGRLNSNRYDPDSTSNPYGVYGSPYSSKSINNPYGRYGSRYSSESSRNPYATKAPRLFAPSFESRALDLLEKPSP